MMNTSVKSGKRAHRQAGQSLVESALVVITVLATIVFIIDCGHLMLMENFITERVRETARAAAVNNWTTTQIGKFLVYNDANSTSTGAGYMGLTTSEVTASYLGTSGTPDYRVQVKVSGVSVFPVQLFSEWSLIGSGSFSAPPVVITMPVESAGSTS